MREMEKEILQAYKTIINEVGSRGPRNIYVKLRENRIFIHFSLVKSPLEEFIYENFEDSISYLEDMYRRINEITIHKTEQAVSERIGKHVKFTEFDINVENDEFCLVLEIQS